MSNSIRNGNPFLGTNWYKGINITTISSSISNKIIFISDDNYESLRSILLDKKIDKEITYLQSKKLVKWLIEINLINNRESKIILSAIDDKSLGTPIRGLNDILRARILKNIIEELFSIEE